MKNRPEGSERNRRSLIWMGKSARIFLFTPFNPLDGEGVKEKTTHPPSHVSECIKTFIFIPVYLKGKARNFPLNGTEGMVGGGGSLYNYMFMIR